MKYLYAIVIGLISISGHAQPTIDHNLTVNILPKTGQIHVFDTIKASGTLNSFKLNEKLHLVNSTIPLKSSKKISVHSDLGTHAKVYSLKEPTKEIMVEYSGQIALTNAEELPAISEKGVFLSRASLWFPVFNEELTTFNMTINLPADWTSMSQGDRTHHQLEKDFRKTTWVEKNAQDDIYIFADKLVEESKTLNGIQALVYTKQKDLELANRYIGVTFDYIKMYTDLIGPYPYNKFAVVEGFEGSGYGFPSFTMLGPRVIRFPFILYTSYPHEILHNWWGNGVYVDYEKGNWAEGLTAYLSDHLMKEQKGKGSDYRRDTLQKYSNFVQTETDFALTSFRSRHNQASSAIGYGKTLMLFHMLRLKIGDELFKKGLQEFYAQNKFKLANFEQIEKVFASVSDQKLDRFFQQWIEWTGSPELEANNFQQTKSKGTYKVSFDIIQKNVPYALEIPVGYWEKAAGTYHQQTIHIEDKTSTITIPSQNEIARIQIDPQFDIFRRLDQSEIPAALGQGFGSPRIAVILPNKSDSSYSDWKALAINWKESQSGEWFIVDDTDDLPDADAVWILGKNNKHKKTFIQLLPTSIGFESEQYLVEEKTYGINEHSFVGCRKLKNNTLCFVGESTNNVVKNLARKLPHYHKYGYLVFKGDEGQNVAKGSWQIDQSPFVHDFGPSDRPLKKIESYSALTQAAF